MKLSMMINYVGDFQSSAKQVVELEKVGLDLVWVAEAYSYDAISQIGYLAAVTNRVEIGTGIINVYSRTAALVAMTAAGCDYVSGGRPRRIRCSGHRGISRNAVRKANATNEGIYRGLP